MSKVKTDEDVDDSCPQDFFDNVNCLVKSSTPLLMSLCWLATSVFHFSLAIALG